MFAVPRLSKPILVFIGVAILSLGMNASRFSGQELGIGSLYLVRWTLYAALYAIVIQKWIKGEVFLTYLFAIGAGFGVLGLIQFFLYPNLRNLMYLGWDPHFYRLFSTLLDPNFAGILLVLTVILGVYLWENKKIRRWVVAGALVSATSLLLTYSRSSFLAAIAAGVALTVFTKQWRIMVGIALFVGMVLVFPRTSGSTLRLLRTDSSLARVGNWQEGLALIRQRPLLGHGFNTLRHIREETGEFVSKSASGLDSSILFVGATTGMVGLVAYGYLLYKMLRLGRKLGFVTAASFIALGVHSLFVNSAFYPLVLLWFWVLMGAAERAQRR